MGWIFGISGSKITQEIILKIKALVPDSLYTYQTEGVFLLCGGLRETCLSSLAIAEGKRRNQGWIVCGLGISPQDNSQKHILSSEDWDSIFNQPEPRLTNLEGHFVAIRWDSKGISGYVDSRGLRELYITTYNNNVLFSTRLDWFAKYGVGCALDFLRFGSRWLAGHQLSNESVVNSVKRLGPGGSVYIKDGSYSIHKSKIFSLPRANKPLEKIIYLLSTFPQEEGYKVIILLSGGTDSRILLAALLSCPISNWQICIFGSPRHPDVKIARRIVRELNLNYSYFDNSIPDESSCIRLMRNFVVHTQCIAPVSDAIRLGFYPDLYNPKNIIIDGAFGEIMRRVYFGRLFIRGRTALVSGKPKKIMQHLRVKRGDFFESDVVSIMLDGFEEDVENLWQKFKKCGMAYDENFLDLLAIHTRLPNLFGLEVSRLDQLVLNYMPFAQPTFLAAAIQTNPGLKRNDRLARLFIKKGNHKLAKYHFVKDNEIYPFMLSHRVLRWIWKKFKVCLRLSYQDALRIELLNHLKTFIMDTIHSQNTRSFGAYDIRKIDNMVNNFYRGDQRCGEYLSWWLTFELWRQECSFGQMLHF